MSCDDGKDPYKRILEKLENWRQITVDRDGAESVSGELYGNSLLVDDEGFEVLVGRETIACEMVYIAYRDVRGIRTPYSKP